MTMRCDVAIIGSGFVGSILASILAKHGRKVVLIDSAKHPRFAIGESSTPIADSLLAHLGQLHGLDPLVQLSQWGSWQNRFPQLACGRKRGFSYFDHRVRTGEVVESAIGRRSLLVAASPTDNSSDTQWYRADVDEFLVGLAKQQGVVDLQETTVQRVAPLSDDGHALDLSSGQTVRARYVIDASGGAAVTARLCGIANRASEFETCTSACFGHFHGVGSFSDHFNVVHGDNRARHPFDADDAAQHHLINEGWVWMLRMNNGVTSVGIASPMSSDNRFQHAERGKCQLLLEDRFTDYPLLHSIMEHSKWVSPKSRGCTRGRLQRQYDPIVSNRCVLTPTTAVTIDPLHSTGIAHGLAGVHRLSQWLLSGGDEVDLRTYREVVLKEAVHLDRLISLAYRSMFQFDAFTAACMIYFAAAITCEESMAGGSIPATLWLADDRDFASAVSQCSRILANWDLSNGDGLSDQIRELIEPWNTVGLLDPSVQNRYAYTATKG